MRTVKITIKEARAIVGLRRSRCMCSERNAEMYKRKYDDYHKELFTKYKIEESMNDMVIDTNAKEIRIRATPQVVNP